jgi:phenylacetate-coenzyme A ligase PaaK-like adenylate-forming protein
MNLDEIEDRIFNIENDSTFEYLALDIFKYQYHNCSVYNQYCNLLNIVPEKIKKINNIPFLPIQFFKTKKVISGNFKKEIIFSSSGTTGNLTSKHYIKDLSLYKKSFLMTFKRFYPNWKEQTIIGLLPSYLEREGSSLIYMVNELINQSKQSKSKFQLNLDEEFINYLESDSKPKIIFGVTFALLEMAELGIKPKNAIIIETGGMKGRGEELTREELHFILQKNIQPKAIHSEYGMTELLSQAYLQDNLFKCSPWLKPLIRELTDPFKIKRSGRGVLNLIDLANLHSCSFIATDDLGILDENGDFNVSGRIDHSQIRGCNLLMI